MKKADFNKYKDILEYCDRQEKLTTSYLESTPSLSFIAKRKAQIKLENINKLRIKVKNSLYGLGLDYNNNASKRFLDNVISLNNSKTSK